LYTWAETLGDVGGRADLLWKVEVGVEIVYDLSEDSGPVDAVDRAESVSRVEFGIGEQGLDDVLVGMKGVDQPMIPLGSRHMQHTWQSSKVPSTATQCTFSSGTVAICASWIGDTRPYGYRMKMDTSFLPRRP
jgi:hypothetical protein